MSAHRALVALVFASSALGSCAPVATQLVVRLESNVPANLLRSLDVSAGRDGDVTPIVTHRVAFPGGALPTSFGVVAARADDSRPVVIQALLTVQDAMGPAYVAQTAKVTLRAGRVLSLTIGMDVSCARRMPINACPMGQTCAGTLCIPVERTDVTELTP